MPFGLSDTE